MLVQKVAISRDVPGSCPPKSFEGKPSTAKPRGEYFACSCCSPSYCGVKPHLDAVLTISSTLPAQVASEVGVPSSRVIVKPWIVGAAGAVLSAAGAGAGLGAGGASAAGV